jgi:hypothetical protein
MCAAVAEIGAGQQRCDQLALDQSAPLPPGVARRQERASDERQALDFTIELAASNGTTVTAPASRFADTPPPPKEKFTTINFIERDRSVFQTVRAPPLALSVSTGTRLILESS